MENIYNQYLQYEENIRNQNLNEDQRLLLDNLLVKLQPYVHILTHLSEYKNPNAEFRKNRIAYNDPKFILFHDDLTYWITNNQSNFEEQMNVFYTNVQQIINPILPANM